MPPSAASADKQSAVASALHCARTCYEMAMSQARQPGGKPLEVEHLALMLNCADLCETTARFLINDSPVQARVAGVCAEVCQECARHCERVNDMNECVDACRACAVDCGRLSSMGSDASARERDSFEHPDTGVSGGPARQGI
jgi:hypothetical protein